MRTRSRGFAAMMALGVFLVAGCGGNEAVALHPCELLTPAEVEEALGQPVEAERLTETDCSYTGADPRAATNVTLSVLQMEGSGEAFGLDQEILDYSAELAGELSGSTGESTQQVDGLGDAATLVTTGSDTGILHVKAGGTLLTLTVFGLDEPDGPAETASQLARLVLERLS